MTIRLYTDAKFGGVEYKTTEIHALVWAHTPRASSHLTAHMRRIFETGEARNCKFGTCIDLGKFHLMNETKYTEGVVVRAYKGQIFKC